MRNILLADGMEKTVPCGNVSKCARYCRPNYSTVAPYLQVLLVKQNIVYSNICAPCSATAGILVSLNDTEREGA